MKKTETAASDENRKPGRGSFLSRFLKWIEKGRSEAPLCSS